MKIENLEQLFQEQLRDLYDAEKQLVRALPKMAKQAASEELRAALNEHLEVTKKQVERLDQVFETTGGKPKSHPCLGMRGIVEEGKEVMQKDANPELMDCAIIGSGRRVEHYEIAAYLTTGAMAERLGNTEAVELLKETLNEEREADQKLSEISERLMSKIPAEPEEEGQERVMTAGGGRHSRRSSKR